MMVWCELVMKRNRVGDEWMELDRLTGELEEGYRGNSKRAEGMTRNTQDEC